MKKSRVKTCVDRQMKNIVGYQEEKKKKRKIRRKRNVRRKEAFKCSGFSAAQRTKWFNKF